MRRLASVINPTTLRLEASSHSITEVLREAEEAETVEQSFKAELHQSGLEGDWHLLDAGEEAELIELAKSST